MIHIDDRKIKFEVIVTTPDQETTVWAANFLMRGLEDTDKELAENSPTEYTPSDFKVEVS
jgi:hypothetical protein